MVLVATTRSRQTAECQVHSSTLTCALVSARPSTNGMVMAPEDKDPSNKA